MLCYLIFLKPLIIDNNGIDTKVKVDNEKDPATKGVRGQIIMNRIPFTLIVIGFFVSFILVVVAQKTLSVPFEKSSPLIVVLVVIVLYIWSGRRKS